MATSGSFSTNQVKAGSRIWYWDFSWSVVSWSGNTATINWSAVTRATSGTSGQSYVSNYGFSITVNGSTQTSSSSFYKDNTIASGSFTKSGGTSFSVSITAHPYGSSYTSSGNSSWTLDNNVVKPSVTCTIASTSETTVTLTGTITSNGNATITASGYQKSTDNSNWTACTNSVTGLNTNTKYYFRYYATNSAGTTYSSSVNTTTWKSPALTSITTSALIAGNAQTVNLTNEHSRNCSITVKDGNNNTLYTGSTSGTSLTFTIPADKCRTALGSGTSTTTSANLTYTCVYSSWTTTKTGTLGINTSYTPSWSSNFAINTAITYADIGSETTRITGNNQILVQGKSSWEYSLALTGNQAAIANSNSGSSIKEYQVSTDGGTSWTTRSASATHISVGTVGSTATSVTVKIKAVDYKGLETSVQTKTISVTPYTNPSGTISVNRQNNYGEVVQLKINPSWAIASVNHEEWAEVYYKLSTASTYTLLDDDVETFNSLITLEDTFDNTLSYDFKVILYDAFGEESNAILASVGPGMPILFIDETVNGVGINTIPTEQGLFVDGKTNLEGNVQINGATTIGTSNATKNLTVTGTMTGKLINDYSGYVTSGTSGLSSYWFKVWDGTFTSVQYDDKCYTLQVNGGYSSLWGQISFRIRQNGANNGGAYNLTCQLYRLSGSVALDRLRLYYNNTNGKCALWVNCGAQYGTFNYQVLSKTGRTTKEQAPFGTFYSGAYTSAQTLPSDSYVTMVDITVLNAIYPVGSIYMSVNSTSPATLFGGTWERLPKGKFLYNINSDSASWSNGNDTGTATNAASGNTGATTLTAAQSGLRSHQHKIYGGWNNGGSGDDAYGYSSAYAGDRGWKTYGMETIGDSAATSSHTHTLNSHTHNIPYIAIYMWRRTA